MIIGFTASAFDLGPHAGHVQMLKEAKDRCNHLIVGLHVDPSGERDHKNKPLPPVSQRYLSLIACQYVDEVIPYETEAELMELLLLINPDIRFLGEDYRDREFTGKMLDIQIHFCERKHNVSSSKIRKAVISQGAKG